MNNNYPLISVVIPCYNSGDFLTRSIGSIIDQTYQNIEIIVINDGSTDIKTLKILKFYKNEKKIRIINQKNKGLSAARNVGIKKSLGDYIYFLDSDDWLDSRCLKVLYEKIKNIDNCYAYSSIKLSGDKSGNLKKYYNLFEELFTNQIPYSCLYPKILFEKFGLYDEKMKLGFEDWEMHIRLGIKGVFGVSLDKFYFNYNVSRKGMLQNISLKNYYQIYKYIRNKHHAAYKLKNLIIIYKKYKEEKSTHNILLYFLYFIYINVLPVYVLNYFLKSILNFSHSSREEKKLKNNLKKNEISTILHVITSSDIGGAEKALYTLIKSSPTINHIVITLKYKDKNYVKFPRNVNYFNLSMSPKKINFYQIIKLIKLINSLKYDAIQSWLYHSDFLVSLICFFTKKKIIWTVHNNNLDLKILGLQTFIIIYFCKFLSYSSPYKIIFVSKSSMKKHTEFGYNKEIATYIPPLISEKTNFFQKEKKIFFKKKKLLQKNKNIVLGCLARWDVQKNQKFLLECLSELKQEGYKFILFMAGKNIENSNKELKNYIISKKLNNYVKLLGPIKKIDKFFNAIDLNILPSLSESFPLVIHESQYYATPSLASNVGDVDRMMKLGGWIFTSNNKVSFKIKYKLAYKTFLNNYLWKNKCLEANKTFSLKLHNNKSLNSYLKLLNKN